MLARCRGGPTVSPAPAGDTPEPGDPGSADAADVPRAVDAPDPAGGVELPGQEYAVLVVDPQTAEVDVYGPFDGPEAVVDAARRREEHDRADLQDVLIQVTRLQRPPSLGRHSA